MTRQDLGVRLFLIAAVASFLLSIALWFTDNQDEGVFVGLWVPFDPRGRPQRGRRATHRRPPSGEMLETAAEDPRLRAVVSEGGRCTLPGRALGRPRPPGALQKPLSDLVARTLALAVLFNQGPTPA